MNENNKMRDLDEAELEGLFAAARAEVPAPAADLLARIMADADACQPTAPAQARPQSGRSPMHALVRGALAAIGGWGGLAGLATAALAGVWIGYAHPEMAPGWALSEPDATDPTFDLSDFEPRFDDFTPLMEGS